MANQPSVSPETFVPMQGRWRFDNGATYLGSDEPEGARVGVCLSSTKFRQGVATVKAKFTDVVTAARILIGYNATTGGYYSVGLGGYRAAYLVDTYIPTRGWHAEVQRGDASQLLLNHSYALEVEIKGQQISFSVDGVRVIDTTLPVPLQGDQAGLFSLGTSEVRFENFELNGSASTVFVVMQFGEPYDALYKEVIDPVAQKLGFTAVRADDVYRPGIILEDIRRGIIESDVVIAEITPTNANVFYELGYAHALEKQTILLANRNIEKLPFDISGYRVIFYDDTIGGKRDIESTLRKHLDNIRKGQVSVS
jgi:hypothetical protein